MVSNIESVFSKSAQSMKRSAIREILKLTQKPEIISFAGGLPDPETFPVDELKKITCEVLDEAGAAALQYGTTEGDVELRNLLIDRYKEQGANLELENLIILTSSQQGLSLVGKVFLDPGDKVICGLPSYLGGISSFKTCGADLIGIKFDESGMRSDKLEEKLKDMQANGEKPKFIYIIPDFQNPAGITMPEKRRLEIIEIAHKYDVLIVEDSPYREIRFEGEHQRTMYQLDNSGHVLTLGTFSKIFAPGFRLGWALGHKDVLDKIVMAKQTADLCTSCFLQKIAAKYIKKGYFDANLKKTISLYHEKRDIMLDGFRKYMPEGVTWTEPEGGLFLFLTLPENMDAEKLLLRAIEKNVAFVIGSVFHADDSGKNTMRLNFSFVTKEQNVEGVKRLAEAIKEEMESL
jgi:2-aminoadipate transaminase